MMLSSKFTFSLIAITALFLSGSAIFTQDSFAAIDAPEFAAIHLNTTATLVKFDQKVNGTLAILDWAIKYTSTATAGSPLTDVAIQNIANSSSTGVGLTVPGTVDKKTGVSSAAGVVGLGYINGTDFVLIHSAIDTDSTYFVNYTNNGATLADSIGQFGQIHANEQGSDPLTGNTSGSVGAALTESAGVKYLKIGSNATAQDCFIC